MLMVNYKPSAFHGHEDRTLNILGARFWSLGVTGRHRSRDHLTGRGHFPIGGQWWPCVYLAPLRKYKDSKLHLPMLKAKSSLRMLLITTCRQGVQNDHIFGIPEAILSIQYTTFMGLRWRLGAVYRWNFLYRSILGQKFVRFGPNFRLWGIFRGLDINFEFRFQKRFDPCVRPLCSSHRSWKSAGRFDL